MGALVDHTVDTHEEDSASIRTVSLAWKRAREMGRNVLTENRVHSIYYLSLVLASAALASFAIPATRASADTQIQLAEYWGLVETDDEIMALEEGERILAKNAFLQS